MDEKYAYVAYKDCGCAVGVCMDLANKFTADSVHDWIRHGFHVERVKSSDLQPILEKGLGCKCPQKGQGSLF